MSFDLTWRKVSVHEVIFSFLEAEKHRLSGADAELIEEERECARSPALDHKRYKLLLSIRGPLWAELPPDTLWFNVTGLHTKHFSQLHVIGRCKYPGTENDDNALLRIAPHHDLDVAGIENAGALILFAHTAEGPFTIIEGNKRLIALAGSSYWGRINNPVFVGLSEGHCVWHSFDPAEALLW